MWKYGTEAISKSEYLLDSSLIGMLEHGSDIFAAGKNKNYFFPLHFLGNCYDKQQFGSYFLYCPYAYRLPNGSILAKNLAAEYDYLAPSSTWFFDARTRAQSIIRKNEPILRGECDGTCKEIYAFAKCFSLLKVHISGKQC